MGANNQFNVRRQRILIAFFLRRFFDGVQVGILIPSMWIYLKSLGASPVFFGLTNGLPFLIGLLCVPFVGRLYDRTLRCREIIAALNLIEITGGILYSLPFSRWLLLFGRIIIGVGAVVSIVMSSEIAWITRKEERMAMFAKIETGLLLGIFTGPPLSFAFRYVHIKVGAWTIDFRNAPSVTMVLLWIVVQVLTQTLITNLAKDIASASEEGKEIKEDHDGDDISFESDDSQVTGEEKKPMLKEMKKRYSDSNLMPLSAVLKEHVFTPEIFSIFFVSFLIWTNSLGAEVMTPLITKEDLHWNATYISLVYVGQAFIASACYFSIITWGKNASDRLLLSIGTLCTLIVSLLLIVLQIVRGKYIAFLITYIISAVSGTIAFAMVEVGGKSLLSKVTNMESQGVIQGCQLVARKLSNVTGSLFMSFAFSHLYLAGGILTGLGICGLIWFSCSYSRLHERELRYDKASEKSPA